MSEVPPNIPPENLDTPDINAGPRARRRSHRPINNWIGLVLTETVLFLGGWYIQNWIKGELVSFLVFGMFVFFIIVAGLIWAWKIGLRKKWILLLGIICFVPFLLFSGRYWGMLIAPRSRLSMGGLPTIEFLDDPTYTKEPTPTPCPTCIPTKTPIPPSTPTPNDSITTSITTTPFFSEDFTNRAAHPWNLQEDQYYIAEAQSVELDIESGKLDATVYCDITSSEAGSRFNTNVCQINIKIPTKPRDNFDIKFDATIGELTFGAFGVTTSSLDETASLTFLFTTEPAFLFVKGLGPGNTDTQKTPNAYDVKTMKGDTNNILMSFTDNSITAYVNGEKIYYNGGRSITGDNIISLTIYSEGYNSIQVLFDELYILPNADSTVTE